MSTAIALSVQTPNHSLQTQHHKGVKHLYDTGIKHVPSTYILPPPQRPNNVNFAGDTLATSLDLPVVHFAQLQGPDRLQALKSLANACETYGFFQLVNHGIPEEIVGDMVKVTNGFFEMPVAERERYMSADTSLPVRYGTSFNQINDRIFCWRDFLKLACHPLPEVLPHWPSSPKDFSELAVSYAKQTRALFINLSEAILETLELDKNNIMRTSNNDDEEIQQTFKELEEHGSQLMVLNCYPPCPDPDLTLGMPPHSDYGFLTILLQDEIQGLQIQHQDKWLTVNPIPGSFVINVGDHLEIFSNGRFKSVLHRVIVNSIKCRISVASLHSFPVRSSVRPYSRLISETNPRLYKDTDFAAFLDYIKSCDSEKKSFLESRKIIVG